MDKMLDLSIGEVLYIESRDTARPQFLNFYPQFHIIPAIATNIHDPV